MHKATEPLDSLPGGAVAADPTRRPGVHRRLYDWVLHWADTPHGAVALFVLAFAESSFFPIPPDVLLIALVLGARARWAKFALICTVGSVLGGVAGYGIGYGLMESVGMPIIRFYQAEKHYADVQALYAKYDYWIVFAAAFTPIPYKVFTIASGAFKMNMVGFVLVSIVGRGARFFIVATLLYYFGPPMRRFIDKYFNLLCVAFMLLLIGGFAVLKLLRPEGDDRVLIAAVHWQEWYTLVVLGLAIVGLVRHAHAADVILLGALALLVLSGVISPAEGLAGFKNEGVLTVGALFVVAAGLVQTGFLSTLSHYFFGRAENARGVLVRFLPPIVTSSAFLNNTTVVAMAMPALLEWTRKRRIAASAVLLPLSYASIIGGVCTLIGTSTNLVVHGLMRAEPPSDLSRGLGMWELARVGVPIAILGLAYLVFIAPRLLPDRKEFLEQLGDTRREYLAELIVERGCPLIGQTVQQAGLRHLPGLFLIEIDRGDQLISPVEPDERLEQGDRLVFTGVVSTIVDLQKIPALVPAAEAHYEIDPAKRQGRRLCEAVVSVSSPLVGKGVREANFRGRYNAAVVAVHRNGRRLTQKIGDVRLQPGDTLLLETGAGFVLAQRNNPAFYLVSEVGDAAAVRHDKAWIAASITAAMIFVLTLPELLRWTSLPAAWSEWFDAQRVTFAILAAGLMIATRCVSPADARRSIDWSVLLMIAASFGVGAALSRSGAASSIADGTVQLFGRWGPVGVLAGIYIVTWILTELMSNNAAAALMFPVAVATAHQLGVDPRPYCVCIAIAASGGFLFPAGYQTHLMVFGPGGYKVGDFIKVGLPMVAMWFVVTILLVPIFWPLQPQ